MVPDPKWVEEQKKKEIAEKKKQEELEAVQQ